MAISDTKRRAIQLISQFGRAFLNAKYPDEFEIYACSFELRDANEKLKYIFVFPIMPSQIRESEPNLSTVTKTVGGITVVKNETFAPISIQINGNFGRNFKLFFNTQQYSLPVFGEKLSNEQPGNEFDVSVKTGFGCIQQLRKLFQRAKQIDQETGKPYRLYFFNLSLNTGYIVETENITLEQTLQTNTIWNYTLSMKGVAPKQITKQQKTDILVKSIVTSSVKTIANRTTQQLSQTNKANQLFN